jgi:S-(hydroxymethyl)glutathione dehydrogenase/alcohol dehydrogenase
MRAALLTAHNAPLELAEIAPAGPLEFGQVLVRVLVSGLCGAQLQEIRGEKSGPLPHLMGHEGCGIVEEVGPAVTRVKVGDKVVMHWRKAAGIESPFPRYTSPDGISRAAFTSGLVTTLAEKTICSENRLTPVPADTDPELCALLGCSLSTALATIETEAARWGENVLIIGCGGLGLALLSALNLAAPATICACDIHESKRRPAEIAGARFVNLDTEKLTGDYDLILDTAGATTATETALERLAPSGRYVMIGQHAPQKPVCIANARHLFAGEGKSIRATQGGGFRPDLDIPRYLRVLAERDIYCSGLITHRLRLDEINHALDLVRSGNAGRILIQINAE